VIGNKVLNVDFLFYLIPMIRIVSVSHHADQQNVHLIDLFFYHPSMWVILCGYSETIGCFVDLHDCSSMR
jgi:hypothetical protein